MRYLSGATGYTIFNSGSLELPNKSILLLSDIHDGVNYCLRNQPTEYIDIFLEEKSKSHQILLEESINDPELNLTELWPDAEHTTKLRELKEENNKIIPVDLRPYLIPFSWQFASSNDAYRKFTISQYLHCFDNFFNYNGKTYEKFIFPYYEFINTENKKRLYTIFILIKNEYLKFKSKYPGVTKIGDLLEKDKSHMDSIDHINSLIMEYYILVLILSDRRDTIIHTGLAHSTRLKKFLVEDFNFIIKKDSNMTHINQYTGSNQTVACIPKPDFNI